MARPTKYTEDMPQQVDDWLKTSVDKWESIDNSRNDQRLNVELPTMPALANFLDVNKDTLYDWASKYPKFSDSLKKVVQEQERRLLNMGLAGHYNPTIAKLILSSNHGYAEKTEQKVDHTVSDAETIAKAKALLSKVL